MSITLERLSAVRLRTTRRQFAGIVNRRIGWVAVPVVGGASLLHNLTHESDGWAQLLRVLDWTGLVLTVVHVALAIYVFGFPRPQTTLRVANIWLAYTYLAFMLGAIATFGFEPLHTVLVAGMYLFLVVHVATSAHFSWRRTSARPGNVPS